MTVTDEQVAALRAYLDIRSDKDADEAERRFRQLARHRTAEGIGELLYAAFTVAACHRFSPTWTPADIVRFVAQVRAQSSDEPSEPDHACVGALITGRSRYPLADRARSRRYGRQPGRQRGCLRRT